MRRGLTSQAVRDFVASREGPVSEAEVLAWARNSPAATVKMLLAKSERAGELAHHEMAATAQRPAAVTIWWAPAAAAADANKPKDENGKRARDGKDDGDGDDDVEKEIASLAWVEQRYDNEVGAHMERLHVYNETRDAAQEVLGRLATAQSVTVKSLYPRFGLEQTD